MTTFQTRVRGFVFCTTLFLSSTLGVLFLMGPFLPVMFLSPRLFSSIMDSLLAIWLYFTSSLLEQFVNIRIVVTGDEIRGGEGSLLLLNHRTRMDWLYLWPVMARQAVGLTGIKIVLKSMLKSIPGAGWAMQMGAFIFINRKWEEDQLTLNSMLKYYARTNRRPQIVLFPEGTDLTVHTKSRSDVFAEKNKLPKYDYVLHPRTTGFTFLAEQMKNNNLLDAVYDISVAYPTTYPTSELQLFAGTVPESVHFHITRYATSSLPHTEEGLQVWCQDRWVEKEACLKQFYVDKQFNAVSSSRSMNDIELMKKKLGSNVEQNNNNSEQCMPTLLYMLAVSFMCIFIPVTIVVLYVSWAARIFALAQIGFYIAMTSQGGFERFQSLYVCPFDYEKKVV